MEILLPPHCGILLQLGVSLAQTSNANSRRVFRLFPTCRLPACADDLLTPFLLNKIPGYDV
jgi:hypothetical protein